MLTFKSSNAIESRIIHTEKHIIDTVSSRFAFLTTPRLRGIPSTSIYCYEQIQPDRWILRCYLPVIIWNFENLPSSSHISYRTDDNLVEVLCNGVPLYSIKSVRDVPQK